MTMKKMELDDAVISMAASVTARARDLVLDGWTKGMMSTGAGGVEAFCVHGALRLAISEVFGDGHRPGVAKDVEDVAVAFMCDAAFNTNDAYKHAGMGIPMGSFNDAATRKHEEVVSALSQAADRLWAIALDDQSEQRFEFSQWAEVDTQSEQAQQFLHSTLN